VTGQVGRSVEAFEESDQSPAAGLSSFLRVIARHRVVFAAVILLCLLGAGAWLAYRTPSYRATAEILVSPIPTEDESLVGLPLIRESQLDPQRAAVTAAPLLDSPAAARLAAADLDLSDPGAVSSAVTVTAVPDSSLVRVSAEGSSANRAAAVANAYAEAALRVRDRFLAPQVRAAIQDTEEDLESVSSATGAEANALAARLAALRSIARSGDPTLALARKASPGTPQDTPRVEVLLVALLAGVMLAGLTVVMIELLVAQPINTEAELRRLYPLPVLARVSRDDLDSGEPFRRPLSDAPSSVREGFRALRDQLELRASESSSRTGGWGSTVLVVSPERSDTRSGCALDLARAFSSIHDSATVVELNVRDPKMAAMLAVDPPGDVSSLLSGARIGTIGVPFDGAGSLLVAAPPVVDLATREAISARSAEIVAAARQRDGWVVVDAPPITEATADAVAALQEADYVVVIAQLGSTRPEALSLLREAFEQRGRRPDGYLVVSGNLERGRRLGSPS